MTEMNETADFQESTKKDKENKIYEYDDLLRLTGGFGRYQVRYININIIVCTFKINLYIHLHHLSHGRPTRLSQHPLRTR